jgi:hypothetical protein
MRRGSQFRLTWRGAGATIGATRVLGPATIGAKRADHDRCQARRGPATVGATIGAKRADHDRRH